MDDSYVCSGAVMKCTMGTSQARLTVPPMRTVFLTGQPMANISDHLTMANLAPFGRCRSLGFPATAAATAAAHGKLTPMPCMHNTPFPWMRGKNDYIIKGFPALLKSSTCQCMWGGTISLVTDGQTPTAATDMTRAPKGKSGNNQNSRDTSRDGSLADKYNKAVEYWNQGNGIISSAVKANHDINFRNSRNSQGFMSDDDADLRHSNKNYGKNGQYGINCATTTTTFMLRKRGYDVTARARNANSHTDTIAYGFNLYDVWRNPDGSEVTPTMLLDEFNSKIKAKGLTEEMIKLETTKSKLINTRESLKNGKLNDSEKDLLIRQEKTLKKEYFDSRNVIAPVYKEVITEACKEEGYYTFGLVWEKVYSGGGHYTVLKSEKDKDGNMIITHIEPQTGEPFASLDEMIGYLDFPPDYYDTLLRTDNKVFNEEYNDLFDI